MVQRRLMPKQAPPPDGMSERRKEFRRDEDMETHEVAEKAVSGAWRANVFLRWGKLATAALALATLMQFGMGAMNWKLWGTRDDITKVEQDFKRADSALQTQIDANKELIRSMAGKIDSLVTLQTNNNMRLERLQLIQCFQTQVSLPKGICQGP